MKDINKIYKECLDMIENHPDRASWGRLDLPGEIVVNTRAKTRWGCVKKRAGVPYRLEISSRLLDDNVADFPAYNTMLHEIIHCFATCYQHGPEWKKIAAAVNKEYGYKIKRASDYSEYVKRPEGKYRATCKGCGQIFYRDRKPAQAEGYTHRGCGMLTAWVPNIAPEPLAANEQTRMVTFKGKQYQVSIF